MKGGEESHETLGGIVRGRIAVEQPLKDRDAETWIKGRGERTRLGLVISSFFVSLRFANVLVQRT